MRRVPGLASIIAASILLSACAMPASIQVATWAIDGISYITTKKSVTDHGISIIAGQDCAMLKVVTKGTLCEEYADQDVLVASADGPVTVKRVNSELNKSTTGAYQSLREEMADTAIRRFSIIGADDIIVIAANTPATPVLKADNEVAVLDQVPIESSSSKAVVNSGPPAEELSIEEIANFDTAAGGDDIQSPPTTPITEVPPSAPRLAAPEPRISFPEDEGVMRLWAGDPSDSLPSDIRQAEPDQRAPATIVFARAESNRSSEPEIAALPNGLPETEPIMALWQETGTEIAATSTITTKVPAVEPTVSVEPENESVPADLSATASAPDGEMEVSARPRAELFEPEAIPLEAEAIAENSENTAAAVSRIYRHQIASLHHGGKVRAQFASDTPTMGPSEQAWPPVLLSALAPPAGYREPVPIYPHGGPDPPDI